MNASLIPPLIGMTMGDPAGIGPEILVKTLMNPGIAELCRPLVIGDLSVMEQAVRLCGTTARIRPVDRPDQVSTAPGTIHLLPRSDLGAAAAAQQPPSPATGKAMEKYILTGVDLALAKEIQALVTGPITKTGLKAAGSVFHGHTELIAHRTKTADYAMMLAGQRLKVVLVSIHVPLADVAPGLSQPEITRVITLTEKALRERFGIKRPRLAAAGLNPHAGEAGMFGKEEETIIRPAVETAQAAGIDIQGPLPPDTVFFHAVNGRFDAVVCMYHDQGLIPFKLVHFEDGVNTTLGLPIIRTSVDHGTAYDIAWKGKASAASMEAAVKMAVHQASHRQDY